jgi:hypothetical protein
VRQQLVATKLAQYQVKLAGVLANAGITVVKGVVNGVSPAASYTVGTGVTITAAAVSGDRPLTLDITFSNGDVVTGCNIDNIMSGATPTLYSGTTTKTYGKVAKSMYNYALMKNDNSAGVHHLSFVDGMLNAMVNNLDSAGTTLPK